MDRQASVSQRCPFISFWTTACLLFDVVISASSEKNSGFELSKSEASASNDPSIFIIRSVDAISTHLLMLIYSLFIRISLNINASLCPCNVH
jgi:hypothetical protein